MRTPAFLLAAAMLSGSTGAHAHGGPRPLEGALADLPAGVWRDRLAEVRSRAAAAGVEPACVDRPIAEALRAFERSRQARAAGDAAHAGMLEGIASEWITAVDRLVRARIAEQAAVAAERLLQERTERLRRTRSLLEENQAHLGRLEATWKQEPPAVRSASPRPAKASTKKKGPR